MRAEARLWDLLIEVRIAVGALAVGRHPAEVAGALTRAIERASDEGLRETDTDALARTERVWRWLKSSEGGFVYGEDHGWAPARSLTEVKARPVDQADIDAVRVGR